MMAYSSNTVLPLSISLESDTPLYDQIESQVRQLIVSSVLPAGTVLPSVRALATALGCSVITTRRAYQNLEHHGLIRTLQGRGTIVAEVSEALRSQQRLAPVEAALRSAIAQAKSAGVSTSDLHELLDTLIAKEVQDGE